MIKRDNKGRFVKGSISPAWNKGMKGYINSGSFTTERSGGENNPFYGKKHTGESKRKISINNEMKNNPKIREKVSVALKGRKLPQEVKDKIGIAMRKRVKQGIHNFWKGGISRAYKELNHSLRNIEWRNWREAVFERDNYICQECGARSKKGEIVFLHPHHIFPVVDCVRENKLNLIYEVDNGKTLCIECHKIVHGKNKSFKLKEAVA